VVRIDSCNVADKSCVTSNVADESDHVCGGVSHTDMSHVLNTNESCHSHSRPCEGRADTCNVADKSCVTCNVADESCDM